MRAATATLAALMTTILLEDPASNAESPAATPLPALAANISETSVSGISSGAYMAGQFQIAHSAIVSGAAVIAGGPYGCAESAFADVMPGPGIAFFNLSKAINGCMLNALAMWGVPDPELLAEKTRKLADAGRIDSLASLRNDRVYLFSGSNDHTVVPAIVKAAYEFYQRLGLPDENLTYVSEMPAGHAFVTDDQGLACDATAKPYLVDCDYDQAGEVLRHIYGKLTPRVATPAGTFTEFDQRPFFEGFSNHGMEKRGVVYVPPSCAGSTTCRVHIAYHGCAQNRSTAGEAFVRESGYANWADANAFIILYPEAASSPVNPQGCWDWWGYTGNDYLTRQAPQIEIVFRMLKQLEKPRS
ncbi:PHB depolymerase family esterase [Hyphomicrobium sp.]|uniref:extracellular catalytic domain type 2 short-chain-length polyhydroxyalkanoate depolymerase n=1 Tax=Hyphomicrobium sp. TaxID=82 RepID=UPI0025C2DD6E|nr:PHB depolymerase family esterase [Hyphomicrobium sp.]MCC7251496.1 poly(3-hydroxybutyrate) depolymerase [Hyphomicrobium sp.]